MTNGFFSNLWRNKIAGPIVAQLTQGVDPKSLALSCSLGIALGIFPILGSTTLLCFIVGIFLKLNQPAIQAVNYLVYPFQLALFPVFIRLGEKLFNAEPIIFSIPLLAKEFAQGPGAFLGKYGITGLHGICIWFLIAPFLIGGLYYPFVLTFRKIREKNYAYSR